MAAAAAPSRPSTLQMVVEATRAEDSKDGVSVQEIKRRILAKYPDLQEARLKTSLKKAFEKALTAGTILRVRGQMDAGSALTGSFRVAPNKPAAKTKKEATKPAAAKKVKTYAPAIQVNGAPKKADGKKAAAKKKPVAKAVVKKTASSASSASSALSASGPSASEPSSLRVSPRRRAAGGASPDGWAPSAPAASPAELPAAAPRRPRTQKEAAAPGGKENVSPGGGAPLPAERRTTLGAEVKKRKKRADGSQPAAGAAPSKPASQAAPSRPGPKRAKAKAGSASKTTAKKADS